MAERPQDIDPMDIENKTNENTPKSPAPAPSSRSFEYPKIFTKFFLTPVFFHLHFLPPLFYSWWSRKFSDLSEIFQLLKIIQFIWFYWKNFHLLHLIWKLTHLKARINEISELSKKLEKWKNFRFIGKFSSTANIPIHRIFGRKSYDFSKLGNFSPSLLSLKLRSFLGPGK